MPHFEVLATRREVYMVDAPTEDAAREIVEKERQSPDRWQTPVIEGCKAKGPLQAERVVPGDPIED